jgi:hypothetical protein
LKITEINTIEIIELMRETLEMPSSKNPLDESLIASCVRRVAGIKCPCSLITLVNTTCDSFKYLIEDDDLFRIRIEEIINRLIIGGDLLEINDVSTNDVNAKGTWLFSASPSYLVRANGVIFIFGIVPDESCPIPFLSRRIRYEGCKRFIIPLESENLSLRLKDFGLICLSESAWLKLPKKIDASKYLALMDSILSNSSTNSDIPDLIILDPNTSTKYYKGRWLKPNSQTGRFVSRRPQVFGTTLWCYVELINGVVTKFVDIPFKWNGIIQRGCDGAWALQMAIDFINGNPQVYNIREIETGMVLEFYSPLPLWAERRLIAIGNIMEPCNCLFSYLISKEDLPVETEFLGDYLWLVLNLKY